LSESAPTNDHQGKHVDDESDLDAARLGCHVNEICHPKLLGLLRSEIPIDQIAEALIRALGNSSTLDCTTDNGSDFKDFHQLFDRG